MQKKHAITVILLITFVASFAQVAMYSNEFLSIGVGSQQLAMGGACQASTNGVFSTYWNPAALINIKDDAQIGVMHNESFGGISQYDYIGFVKTSKNLSAIGISMIRNGVDGIPNTLNLIDANGNVNYNNITTFSDVDYAFFLSYAKMLLVKGLSIGGNVKVIRRVVGNFASSWGYGIDLSMLYQKEDWAFGATLRDATTTYNTWKFNPSAFQDVFQLTGNEVPVNSVEITLPKLQVGFSKSFKVSRKSSIRTELDADITFDGKRNVAVSSKIASIDPKFGFEYNNNHTFFIRGGVSNFQSVSNIDNKKTIDFNPSLGAGVRLGKFKIDYALSMFGDKSNPMYSNIFSITYSFNKY